MMLFETNVLKSISIFIQGSRIFENISKSVKKYLGKVFFEGLINYRLVIKVYAIEGLTALVASNTSTATGNFKMVTASGSGSLRRSAPGRLTKL